jgi:nicotinate dehydrogenase subunit B
MSATRAAFLQKTGSLVVAFALPLSARGAFAQSSSGAAGAPTETGPSSTGAQFVDAFIAIDHDSHVTVKFGKVDIGTGIATAIRQIVADELDVLFTQVSAPDPRTIGFPDQGYTAGSASLSQGAVPVRQAAAEARAIILELAAAHFRVAPEILRTAHGIVSASGHGQITYGDLVVGHVLHRTITETTKIKSPDAYTIVGKAVPRDDVPPKVFGSFTYVQNLRVPGMLHGRVVRPSAVGATIADIDASAVAHGVQVVRQGDAFLGVVAPTEWGAIQAMRALKVTWSGGGIPQANAVLADAVRSTPVVSTAAVVTQGDVGSLSTSPGGLEATYIWPYQTHASIGPSCGVADVHADRATIWSATQGIYPLRGSIAQLLGLPSDAVEVRFVEGAGCYGHNGADDVCADAALLSQRVGKPVRVQWMRDQEHGWDPKGPAVVLAQQARLDGANAQIAAWTTEVWSPSHDARPAGAAGDLLAGRLSGAKPGPQLFIGGDRDAKTTYQVPNYRVTVHNLVDGILHSSSMRGLGATQNTFANESFMDELAHAAGAGPLAFRRRYLVNDPRSLELLDALEALASWHDVPAAQNVDPRAAKLHGRGLAFIHYEYTEAYAAVVADVTVTRATGAVRVTKLAVAHDCGIVVNPDGLRNQIEGNAIQATSRATMEQVTYDAQRVTSIDWRTYPILRFGAIPAVTITLLNRIHARINGAGEATTTVIAPAINNAIFDATGVRLRQAPFTPDRVLAGLAATATPAAPAGT